MCMGKQCQIPIIRAKQSYSTLIYPFKDSRIVLNIPARSGKTRILLISIAAPVTIILFSQAAMGGSIGEVVLSRKLLVHNGELI